MPRTKTTILIDERLLDQFRALVVSKHGSLRMLSLEFEEAVRAFLPTEVLRTLAIFSVSLELEPLQHPHRVVRTCLHRLPEVL